nr:PREDICTED: mutS protein homolog 4-like [Bemisia tabaci]
MNQVNNNKNNSKQEDRKLMHPVVNPVFAKPTEFLKHFAASKKPSLSLSSYQPIPPNIKYESPMVNRTGVQSAISTETRSSESSKGVNFQRSISSNSPSSSSQSYRPEYQSLTTATKPTSSSSRTPISSRSTRNVNSWTCSSQSSQKRGTERTTSVSKRSSSSATTSTSNQSRVIIAITEGRGNACGEVGLAAMDVHRPCLILCQLSDTHNYTNTIAKLNVLNPAILLFPNTIVENQKNSKLLQRIQKKLPGVDQKSVHRRFYNDQEGMNSVKSLHLPECSSIELLVVRKYFTLAAAAALVKYVEYVENVTLASQSVPMEYQAAGEKMMIDFDTMDNLELLLSQSNKCEARSLFGILNHCYTFGGKRRLRSAILQPSFIEEDLNHRLDCVTELINNIELRKSIQGTLAKIPDIDALLKICFVPANRKIDDSSVVMINYVILLKTVLDVIPSLYQILQTTETKYFEKMIKTLTDPRFKDLANEIDKILDKDTTRVTGYAAAQFQRCFAIKADVNGLLDVARYTYSELVAEFQMKVMDLAEQYELPLKSHNTSSKGFHITLKISGRPDFSIKNLPDVFIQAQRTKNVVTMTTAELIFQNERIKQALQEVQLMSNAVLQTLLQKIRENTGCLYNICDSIAELDMIVSLSRVSSTNGYVRPNFGSKLVLKSARHPILDFTNSSVPVGNDVIATDLKNYHLITGPNMGGKSAYIKQIALIQIMAQIGCYVPAEQAEVKLIDNLFSRISFDDSIECNVSHFTLELKEMVHILHSATKNSLVIIDEFCRGTATDEGTAIAWATSEVFIHSTVHTFIATHFHFLSRLQYLYPQVSCWYFDAEIIALEDGTKPRLHFTHKLLQGVVSIENYGLKLAESTALPERIKEAANVLAKNLAKTKKKFLNTALRGQVKEEIEIDELCINLINMVDNDQLTLEKLNAKITTCDSTYNRTSQTLCSEREEDHLTQNNENSQIIAPGTIETPYTDNEEVTFRIENLGSDEDLISPQTTQESTVLPTANKNSVVIKCKSQALANLQQYNSFDSDVSNADSERSAESNTINYHRDIAYGKFANNDNHKSSEKESPITKNDTTFTKNSSFANYETPNFTDHSSTLINISCQSSESSCQSIKTGEEFHDVRELEAPQDAEEQEMDAQGSFWECIKTVNDKVRYQSVHMRSPVKRFKTTNADSWYGKTAQNDTLPSVSVISGEELADLEDVTPYASNIGGNSHCAVKNLDSMLTEDSMITEASMFTEESMFTEDSMCAESELSHNSDCSTNSHNIRLLKETDQKDDGFSLWRQTDNETICSDLDMYQILSQERSSQKSSLHPKLHEVSLTSQCSSKPGSPYYNGEDENTCDNDNSRL